MKTLEDSTFVDTSLVFYCAGCIGYRWAVKVMTLVAEHEEVLTADAMLFQEILDCFAHRGDFQRAEILFNAARGLFNTPVEVNVEDFDRAVLLHSSYPDASPRSLLRVATMINRGSRRLCATYSAELEQIREITRVNLMEEIPT